MNPTREIFLFIFISVVSSGDVSGQSTPSGEDDQNRTGNLVANFEPSLAVVTGVLSIMFTLTFVLLVYAKCCYSDLRSDAEEGQSRGGIFNGPSSSRRFSGLDKTAIESLPFFRFSALKGSRQGLECSVCLSRFEDVEILRLLPRCRHAFHIGCIDQWLEQHGSCPLCRNRIAIDDPSVFSYSNSLRLFNQSEIREDSSLELYIEREEQEGKREDSGSSRFSIGGSFRKILKMGDKEKSISERAGNRKNSKMMRMDRFNHTIVVSDVVFKNRWSNVSSSDLMFLNSEMVSSMSSDRFSFLDRLQTSSDARKVQEQEGIIRIKEEMEMKRMFEDKLSSMNTIMANPVFVSENSDSDPKTRTVETGRRSVSEITAVPRLSVLQVTTNASASASASEERRRRLWLPIARRTARWFANREERAQINTTQQHLDV
ncbi:PREDICTED: E3 ubiquitin-protein ligase ATL42-like [Tarenaya hassleriana]|uniref:E3 ubiquitin-protein ligase ATL42-like n=1 Tax=Tarenaya hassleriana TaxID=28532 RepID=UPI00053C8AE8|nr:PREDICTED: E3 ubiquitin-protein ligase ATL42-like [Tarenaya hassleriana]